MNARLGRAETARQLQDLAKDDFAALPFDQEWLFSMSLLSEAAALLCDRDTAAVLYGLLLPTPA